MLDRRLLAFRPGLDPSRLVSFETSAVRPAGTSGRRHRASGLLFALGCCLPAYTITGFDASAHAAEETIGAAENVPRGIVRSVLVSGVAGWTSAVRGGPGGTRRLRRGRAEARGRSCAILTERLPRPLAIGLVAAIVVAQYLCGLATVTSASRMAYAFARDGGLPFSRRCAGSAPSGGRRRSRSGRCGGVVLFTSTLRFIRRSPRSARSSLMSLTSCRRAWELCLRSDLDDDGPMGSGRLVSAAGRREYRGLHRLDVDWNPAAQ